MGTSTWPPLQFQHCAQPSLRGSQLRRAAARGSQLRNLHLNSQDDAQPIEELIEEEIDFGVAAFYLLEKGFEEEEGSFALGEGDLCLDEHGAIFLRQVSDVTTRYVNMRNKKWLVLAMTDDKDS